MKYHTWRACLIFDICGGDNAEGHHLLTGKVLSTLIFAPTYAYLIGISDPSRSDMLAERDASRLGRRSCQVLLWPLTERKAKG